MLDPQVRSWRIGADLFTAFGVLALIAAVALVASLVPGARACRVDPAGTLRAE